jgi:uncharacterized protein YbjT (DUF2867 family)
VQEALKKNLDVTSINRSGKPETFSQAPYTPGKVEWVNGDALDPNTYKELLVGAAGAISCIGAFGSNEVCYFVYVV